VEWSVEKSVSNGVLIWRLAAGFNLSGESSSTGGLHSGRHLAVRGILPGGRENNSGVWSVGAWRWGLNRQAVAARSACFEALYAWRYVTLARRFGSWQRLAVRVTRQATCTAAT